MTNWRVSVLTNTRPSGPVVVAKKPITNDPTTLTMSVPHGKVRRQRAALACSGGVLTRVAIPELRCRLELVLRGVRQDGVVRIAPVCVIGSRGSVCDRVAGRGDGIPGWRAGRRRRGGRPGRARAAGHRPLESVERHRHVVLAEPEEATHPDHHGLRLAIAINQTLVDAPNPLVPVVVDVQARQLRGPPLAWLLLREKLLAAHAGLGLPGSA